MITPDWTLHTKGADLSTKPIQELKNVWWALNDKRNHEASQKKLQAIYEARHDICCSCAKARMFVRYLSSGTYTVVNHPVEGRHLKNCGFYTEVNGYISDKEFGGSSDFKEILTFCYHNDINSTESTEQHKPLSGKNSFNQQSKLLRLMNQLCTEAYMHAYIKPFFENRVSRHKQEARIFAKLRDSASSIQFGDTTLDHYIFYGRQGEQYAERALKAKSWKGAGRRHVFLIEMVNIIQENVCEMLFDGEPVYYERIIRPGLKTTSGPYLVLSSIVEDEGEFFRHTACVKPIVSREVPMLVDSNYERTMALNLIANINEYTQSSKVDYWSLLKPLIPKPNANGEQILPDFILTHKVKGRNAFREIVEVMGSDNEEYTARKQRLIPEMKQKFYSNQLSEVKAYIPGRIEKYSDKIRDLMLSK
ncbi:hypothetical protein DC915_RS01995 [Vibrio parahaemolyticus]|nr:hypothetical protein [Vibrio parahaemolyticus]EJE4724451.1 hypothetical protein [Vibrio parahaemolyticus]EJG0009746.1 hypothetical protein [Vibrio parahaemolyticus]EJO2025636.1 hypothetical protein [Vibrio parahaemolyticus]ELA8176580.1 hypothetical protein [Vibrio alginolyticus]